MAPARDCAVSIPGGKAVQNCRGDIGNPCYLMKKACDEALEAQLD
jgi:hypothetical protein